MKNIKLTTNNSNYSAVVVKVETIIPLQGCDNVVGVPFFGYQAIVSKDVKIGDTRCDTIVKREIYEEHIKDKYNVLFVIDDRVKVVDMWREQGLFVFDVNQTREIFKYL